MIELISYKGGIAELGRKMKSANPRGKKYFQYLVEATSKAEAEALASEANEIGGKEFAAKYNIDVILINE